MMRWSVVLLYVFMSFTTVAATEDMARKQAEASMLVTGTVEINPDGSVRAYVTDQAAELSIPVNDAIQKTIATWKFQVDEKREVIAKAKMTLRIIAKSVDDKHVALSIVSSDIGEDDEAPSDNISWKRRISPTYPETAFNTGATGVVYLLLRIDRDGKVQDASVEQVNLTSYSPGLNLDRMRKDLAGAALKPTKHWTFNVPTTGKQADAPYWLARAPVSFTINDYPSDREQFGKWRVYLRGPRQSIPWNDDPSLLSSAPDTVPEGTIQTVGTGLHLLEGHNGT